MPGTNLLAESRIPSVVDNKAFSGSSEYPVLRTDDPAGKAVLHTVSSVTAKDVESVVASSKAAFPGWSSTPIPERRAILLKARELLAARSAEYAKLEAEETTLTLNFAHFDHTLALSQLDEAAGTVAAAMRGDIPPETPGKRCYIVRRPYGCVFAIAPWNAPSVLGWRSVISAIAGGNTVVLKTSEFSPRVHTLIAQILIDAGLPAGVLNVVHVKPSDAPAVCEAFIAHDFVRKVNFTGSTRVGSIIGSLCGKHVKPVVLELGGQAPMVVTANADLTQAANNVVFGSFANQGQICMSGANAIVHESVRDAFEKEVQKLWAANEEILTASPAQTGDKTHLRALFAQPAAERLQGNVDAAISEGAKVLAGKPGAQGATVQPVVLGGVLPSMKVFSEESFGPVLSIVTYSTIDEAVELANRTEYGLSSSVFSKDESEAFAIADRIDAGAVHINGPTVHDSADVPHGGWKKSGFGRFNGFEGIREFTQTKVITVTGHQIPLQIL